MRKVLPIVKTVFIKRRCTTTDENTLLNRINRLRGYFQNSVFLITTNLSAWYASSGLFVVGLVLALAIYAFHTALGGQKVFSEKLLEE